MRAHQRPTLTFRIVVYLRAAAALSVLLTVAGGGRSLRVWVVEGNLAVEIEIVCDLAG